MHRAICKCALLFLSVFVPFSGLSAKKAPMLTFTFTYYEVTSEKKTLYYRRSNGLRCYLRNGDVTIARSESVNGIVTLAVPKKQITHATKLICIAARGHELRCFPTRAPLQKVIHKKCLYFGCFNRERGQLSAYTTKEPLCIRYNS